MGFRLIRTDLTWSKAETTRGQYDWRPYDGLVADARQRGLMPLLILGYSNPLYAPKWQGDRGRQDWAYEPPVSDVARDAFVAFVRAAAERYRGQVIWEVWNEPNLTFGKPPLLDAYIRLAMEACRAMRAAYPEAAIIGPASGGFAMRLLEDFVKHDAEDCFDGVSVHPYRDWDPDSALADWRRLSGVLGRWHRARPKVPIDSEWGYSVLGGVWNEQRQADYVLRLYLTDLLAGVPITIIYDWRNDGPEPGDKEQNFGLFDVNGKPKSVAPALAEMIQGLAGLTLFGKVHSTADASVLAFGTAGGPIKMAAWSPDSRPIRLVLGPMLCVTPPQSKNTTCGAGDPIIQITPMTLKLSGRPAVFEPQVENCSIADDRAPGFRAWCEQRRSTMR
jgi:hypothetical protein